MSALEIENAELKVKVIQLERQLRMGGKSSENLLRDLRNSPTQTNQLNQEVEEANKKLSRERDLRKKMMEEMTFLNDEIEYLEKRSEDDDVIKEQYTRVISKTKSDKEKLRESIFSLQKELITIRGSVNSDYADRSPRADTKSPNVLLTACKEEIKTLKEEIQKAEDTFSEKEKKIVQLEKALGLEKVNFNEVEVELGEFKKKYKILEAESAKKDQEIARLKSELEDLRSKLKTQTVTTTVSTPRTAQTEAFTVENSDLYKKAKKEKEDLEVKWRKMREEMKQLRIETEEVEGKLGDSLEQVRKERREREKISEKLKIIIASEKLAEEIKEKKEREISELKTKLGIMEAELTETKRTVAMKDSNDCEKIENLQIEMKKMKLKLLNSTNEAITLTHKIDKVTSERDKWRKVSIELEETMKKELEEEIQEVRDKFESDGVRLRKEIALLNEKIEDMEADSEEIKRKLTNEKKEIENKLLEKEKEGKEWKIKVETLEKEKAKLMSGVSEVPNSVKKVTIISKTENDLKSPEELRKEKLAQNPRRLGKASSVKDLSLSLGSDSFEVSADDFLKKLREEREAKIKQISSAAISPRQSPRDESHTSSDSPSTSSSGSKSARRSMSVIVDTSTNSAVAVADPRRRSGGRADPEKRSSGGRLSTEVSPAVSPITIPNSLGDEEEIIDDRDTKRLSAGNRLSGGRRSRRELSSSKLQGSSGSLTARSSSRRSGSAVVLRAGGPSHRSASSLLGTRGAVQTRGAVKKIFIQIKGKTKIHARQISLDVDLLNSQDVFILDSGMFIYLWNGKFASRQKRESGHLVAQKVNYESKAGQARVIILEESEGEDEHPTANWDEFLKNFGINMNDDDSKVRPTIQEIPAESDDEAEKKFLQTDRLYRVSPTMELFEVDGGFQKSSLNGNYCYILDCHSEMYLWRGNASPEEEKRKAFEKAIRMFKEDKTRPKWAVLKKVNEGKEPVLFQFKFYGDWEDSSSDDTTPGTSRRTEVGGKRLETKEDIVGQYDKYFTYDDLVSGNIPASVDKYRKEAYLSDAEFYEVFDMSKDEFYKQSQWKIQEDKKRTNLF